MDITIQYVSCDFQQQDSLIKSFNSICYKEAVVLTVSWCSAVLAVLLVLLGILKGENPPPKFEFYFQLTLQYTETQNNYDIQNLHIPPLSISAWHGQ